MVCFRFARSHSGACFIALFLRFGCFQFVSCCCCGLVCWVRARSYFGSLGAPFCSWLSADCFSCGCCFFAVVCSLRVRWCAFCVVVSQLCAVVCCGCVGWRRFHSYFGAPGAPFCIVCVVCACSLLVLLVATFSFDGIVFPCMSVHQPHLFATCWRAAG